MNNSPRHKQLTASSRLMTKPCRRTSLATLVAITAAAPYALPWRTSKGQPKEEPASSRGRVALRLYRRVAYERTGQALPLNRQTPDRRTNACLAERDARRRKPMRDGPRINRAMTQNSSGGRFTRAAPTLSDRDYSATSDANPRLSRSNVSRSGTPVSGFHPIAL